MDPVLKDPRGKWWFYTESWNDREGPFATERECRNALSAYVANLDQLPARSCPTSGFNYMAQQCVDCKRHAECHSQARKSGDGYTGLYTGKVYNKNVEMANAKEKPRKKSKGKKV